MNAGPQNTNTLPQTTAELRKLHLYSDSASLPTSAARPDLPDSSVRSTALHL